MTATAVPTVHTDHALDDLDAQLTGTLHRPGTTDYDAAAMSWNVSVVNRPIAVVRAADAQDVVAAVRHAGAHDVQVSVQATGHGAYAFARPTLLVNTGGLRELTVSPVGSARVGAGVQWSEVLAAAAPLGFAGLAGSAPGVGVVGFLTGGGIGPLARTYGVSSDYVTAFDVVTGDGRMHRTTATENSDLFWALRGGKGTVGIVTAVEFDHVPLTEILGGCLYFDGADAAAVLHAWREWTTTLPEQATTSVAVMRLPAMPGVPEPLAGTTTVAVRFAWVGDPDAGRAVLAPMTTAGRQVFGGVDVMPYTALGMIHNDPTDPMPAHDASVLLRSLPTQAVDTLVELAGPQAECPQIIVEVRHVGGAVSRAQTGASAFSHRAAEYAVTTIGIAVPPVVAATTAHAEAVRAALAAWSDDACWPNMQASADLTQIVRKYDAATLNRLAHISAAHDPTTVIAAAGPVRAAAR